jgi:hypothetical protein
MWSPISLIDLNKVIDVSVTELDAAGRRMWDLIRIEPAKWRLSPWGDEGGGFWVVANFGHQVLWFNDIEDGFNVSRYTQNGIIDEYFCNQDELKHSISAIREFIESGHAPAKLGPPQPVFRPTSG